MRNGMRRILIAGLALALTGVSSAAGQQNERERIRQAEQRAQEAQQELERAMRLLQEEESREAQQALRQSINKMQRALRELDRNRLAIAFQSIPDIGGVSIVSSFGGPKMGVYLETARDPAVDSIGVEISSVVEGGPADDAGLQAGDIITMANGQSLARVGRRGISPANKLIRIKNELDEGDTLRVEYRRGSESHTADIVLEDLDESSWTVSTGWGEPNVVVAPRVAYEPRLVTEIFDRFPLGWLDIELVTMDEDLGQYFGTSEGLLVIRGSEEGELDLKSGDVILNVDGRVPTSQAHLVRIMRSYEAGEEMNIEIMRNGTRQVVTVEVPDQDSRFRWRRDARF